MKLYENLPTGIIVNGKHYRLNLDFRNVLRMMEILDNDNLMPEAREYLALKCLMKRPRNVKPVLTAVKALLFPQDRPKTTGPKVTSFEHDAGLIRAAFRQVYNIDISRSKLHWFEFIELLQNLPEGNRYTEIVSIRARPLPEATKYNQKEREWLMKAKMQCALPMSEEEAATQYEKDVGNIFHGLLSMIPKDVK